VTGIARSAPESNNDGSKLRGKTMKTIPRAPKPSSKRVVAALLGVLACWLLPSYSAPDPSGGSASIPMNAANRTTESNKMTEPVQVTAAPAPGNSVSINGGVGVPIPKGTKYAIKVKVKVRLSQEDITPPDPPPHVDMRLVDADTFSADDVLKSYRYDLPLGARQATM